MSNTKPLGHAPRFTVRVTQDAIDQGVARNSNHCMIAESIKAAYPKLKWISVDIQTVRATDPDKRERYVWLTPRSNQLAIINYDQGRRPKPWSFELRSGQTIPMGVSSSKRPKKKQKKATMRRPRKGTATSVPAIMGGKAPPRSVGRRRSFGLRSLEF